MLRTSLTLLTSLGLLTIGCFAARADEAATVTEPKGQSIDLFDAATITTPGSWKVAERKSNIIDHEFAATADEQEGKARVTMMYASGSVDANIARWKTQFQLAGDDAAKQEDKKIDGFTVHLVDLAGTYKETSGGPFAGGRVVEREDYAMAGAIIVDPEGRKFFVKMIGPAAIVKANREAFGKMVKGLQAK